jgi:hypothetical protein
MDGVIYFGWLLILFGIGVGAFFGHRFWTKDPNATLVKEWLARYRTFEQLVQDWDKPLQTLDEVVEETRPNMDHELESAEAHQGVNIIGKGEQTFEAAVTLKPQTQESGSSAWTPKDEDPSKALKLGFEWILKMPKGERLPRVWLKGVAISQRSLKALTDFLMGTKENPGPARIFKRQNQEGPAVYFMGNELPVDHLENLPHDFGDIKFRLLDLGAYKIEATGDCGELRTNDLVFSVTAREVGGAQRWFIYLDAREKFARGSGIVMLLEPFHPEVAIQALL